MSKVLASATDELWSPSFVSLLLVSLFYSLGFYMLPTTLPAYVVQIGGSNFQVSLVIAAFATLSLGARATSGAFIDVIGEKKIILAGILVIAATTIAMMWLPVFGIVLVQALRGMAWGFSTAAVATAVYKIVPEGRRGEGSGYYALTTICAVSLTPIAAILLLDHFGFGVMGLVSAAITLVALGQLNKGLASLPVSEQHGHRSISLANIFERGALLPAILSAILTVPLCGVLTFLVLFGRAQGIDAVWTFFIGYTLMILLTRPFIGRLFDRRGHAIIILPGSVATIIGLFFLSMAQSAMMLIVASLFFGFGYGAIQPSLQTWAVNRCPANRKAAATGLFLSSIDIGFLFGVLLLSAVAEMAGYAAMYRYSILAVVLFLVIYVSDLIKARWPRQKLEL